MATKIRLTRLGKKKQPTYRVVVMDSRKPRDGKYIEQLGIYDPRQDPSLIKIDNERALHWLRTGAQPTERAQKLLEISGAWTLFKVEKGEIHTVGGDKAEESVKAATEVVVEELDEKVIEEVVSVEADAVDEEAIEEAVKVEADAVDEVATEVVVEELDEEVIEEVVSVEADAVDEVATEEVIDEAVKVEVDAVDEVATEEVIEDAAEEKADDSSDES